MSGTHERTVFKLRSGRVLRGEAHIRFHHGNLPLLDHQHGHHLHAYKKRIQCVGAIKQRIVLETNVTAMIQKALEVLIVVVQVVLAAEQRFDDLRVCGSAARSFKFFDVDVATQSASNVAGRQRVTLVRGNDADHVDRGAVLSARLRLDTHQFQLIGLQPE